MFASPSKPSTRFHSNDTADLAAKGREWIEKAAAEVRRVAGRFDAENLEILRAAWKLAAPVGPSAAARPLVALSGSVPFRAIQGNGIGGGNLDY